VGHQAVQPGDVRPRINLGADQFRQTGSGGHGAQLLHALGQRPRVMPFGVAEKTVVD